MTVEPNRKETKAMPMSKSTRKWLAGLLAAFVSGGATAMVSAGSVMLVTPESYNLKGGLVNLLMLIASTFAMAGLLGAFHRLQAAPVPPNWIEETETVVQQTTITRSAQAVDSVTAGLPDSTKGDK